MANFFPAGAAGAWTAPVAANSSKVFGTFRCSAAYRRNAVVSWASIADGSLVVTTATGVGARAGAGAAGAGVGAASAGGLTAGPAVVELVDLPHPEMSRPRPIADNQRKIIVGFESCRHEPA
jgi:hypothetical protein